MKKTLFLLLISIIAFCFFSCKKECVCGGHHATINADGIEINSGLLASISVNNLSDSECKDFGAFLSKAVTDENTGTTITYGYICQLQ